MGFEGFIVSDWNSVQNTSGATYCEQIITAVNAGIDMLMEISDYDEVMQIIIDGVSSGEIPQERVDDAVRRIIQVKLDAGIFDDPLFKETKTQQKFTGSEEYRKVAEKCVEESLVLLKNEGNTLPIKEGTTVYITGPAANHPQAQCGGWTLDWNSSPEKEIQGVTTILRGFREIAKEYGINIVTSKKDADKADVVLLVVGEEAYAEWLGDTADLQLCGELGLSENRKAIDDVKALVKPTITCIIAGRHVLLEEKDIAAWDSIVMCYLPGSEGKGVANVLCGATDFHGTLPSPWYSKLEQIGTTQCRWEQGYGLTYAGGETSF